MRIYTEIVYTWDNDKGELVQESSKSFDYEGEVSQCHRKTTFGIPTAHSHDPITEAASDVYGDLEGAATDLGETAVDAGQNLWDDAGQWVGDLYDDAGMFIGEMGQGDWSGWTEFGQTMAEMQGFADPTQLPDWLREMWLGGSDLFYEGQEKIQEEVVEPVADVVSDVVTDPVGTTTDALDEGSSIVTGAVDDAVTTVEEVVSDTGDTLGVDEAVSTVMDTGQDIGESALETATSLGDEISQGGQTVTENVEGVLADNNQPLADAETKINENIADINTDIETGIDENTDTLNDMEDTFNYNVDQGNALLDNTVSIINDVSSGINKHVLDPLLNIANENSLITNPTGWYENAFHNWSVKSVKDLPGGGGEFDQGLIEDYADIVGGIMGGALDDFTTAGGNAMDMWPSDGGASDRLRNRRYMTNAGDPFGNPSETRRLINKQRDFRDAPSMINAGV